jgi:hypothetical protein
VTIDKKKFVLGVDLIIYLFIWVNVLGLLDLASRELSQVQWQE